MKKINKFLATILALFFMVTSVTPVFAEATQEEIKKLNFTVTNFEDTTLSVGIDYHKIWPKVSLNWDYFNTLSDKSYYALYYSSDSGKTWNEEYIVYPNTGFDVGPELVTMEYNNRKLKLVCYLEGDEIYNKTITLTVKVAFKDVTSSVSHSDDINWLAENSITTGYSDGSFAPYGFVARCDMAAFIRRVAKLLNIGDASTWEPKNDDWFTFTDVTPGTDHAQDILWLAHAGISTGYINEEDGTKYFSPYGEVVRCDMAAFLRRMAKLKTSSDASSWKPSTSDWNTFTDINENSYHAEDVLWLAHSGVSEGWIVGNAKEFRPSENVARADMAAFLHRLATKLQ